MNNASKQTMAFMQLGLLLGFVVSLISILWSGLQWATAKKDKAKRARAKKRVLWSLAGLAAIFVAFYIFNVILAMLGVGFELL
jgi:heme O synthase-like polyprenyltransferase